MANNTNTQIQSDDWNINLQDAWQVLWWCRYLNITKSQLEVAVSSVGTVVVDIKRHLSLQH